MPTETPPQIRTAKHQRIDTALAMQVGFADLAELVEASRPGNSWRSIAWTINKRTDIVVSEQALRRWFPDL